MTEALTLRLRTAWAVCTALLYLGIVAGGVWIVQHALSTPSMGVPAALFMGGPPLLVGGAMAALHLALPFLPERPGTWWLHAGLLGLSAVGSCPPLAIPVLVGWLSDPVRLRFGRPAAGSGG